MLKKMSVRKDSSNIKGNQDFPEIMEQEVGLTEQRKVEEKPKKPKK